MAVKKRLKLLSMMRKARTLLQDYGHDSNRFIIALGQILHYLENNRCRIGGSSRWANIFSRFFDYEFVVLRNRTFFRHLRRDGSLEYAYPVIPIGFARQLMEDTGEPTVPQWYYNTPHFCCVVCSEYYVSTLNYIKCVAWRRSPDNSIVYDILDICRLCSITSSIMEEVPQNVLPTWNRLILARVAHSSYVDNCYSVRSLSSSRYAILPRIFPRPVLVTIPYSELKAKPLNARINEGLPVLGYNASPFQLYGVVYVIGDKEPPPKDNRFYGVELEVELLDSYEDNPVSPATKIWQLVKPFGILTTDSSLRNGFEIKTLPATLKAHRQAWSNFFAGKPHKCVSSWASGRCGMHVHVSAESVSPLVLGKLNYFFNRPDNWPFLSVIAGRDITNNHFCEPDMGLAHFTSAFVSQNVNAKYRRVFKRAYDGGGGQVAVDHHNAFVPREMGGKPTYEFRIFKGNLASAGFFKNLEFVDALLEYCQETSTRHIDYRSFENWLIDPYHAAHYRHLAAFLKMKGVYQRVPGKTVYIDEGMTLGGSP